MIAFRPSFEILILPQTFNRIGLKIQGEFRIEAKFKTRAAIIAGGDCIGRRRGGAAWRSLLVTLDFIEIF